MKKLSSVLLILLLLFSFSSCESTKKNERTSEEIQLSLEILLSDSLEMSAELMEIDPEEIKALIPNSLRAYEKNLPLYQELENAYIDALTREASMQKEPIMEIIDSLPMTIPFTYDYINEKDLVSLMRTKLGDELEGVLAERITDLFIESADAWRNMEKECEIFKANWDNLRKVTVMAELPVPEPISAEALAHYLASKAFDAISFAENYLRNRPLSEHSERSYQIFWEGV